MNKGLVLLLDDLCPEFVPVLKKAGIDTLGLHINPYMHKMLYLYRQVEANRELLNSLKNEGIAVEYELHVVSDLIKRTLFEQNPVFFRVDSLGKRNPDYNICASSEEALDLLAQKSYELAEFLGQTSHRYHFWTDDAADYPHGAICHCDKCRNFSGADQNLILSKAILEGIRRYDPQAKLSFLVYGDTTGLPALPLSTDDFFLEFAPYHREHLVPIMQGEINAGYRKLIESMFAVFPQGEAQILEYWLTKLYYSEIKADKSIQLERIKGEIQYYKNTGAGYITTFTEFYRSGADGENALGIIKYGMALSEAT